MNVRQYIGARYVTKIYENSLDPSSAEWEAGVTYEPLTLVTYLNSTYLSKKEVPGSVGDPAANPIYWVVTGAYNGQIATLQNQINDINNNLVTVDNLLDDINNRYGELKSHKYIFVGDSYAASYDVLGCSWLRDFVSLYGIDNSQYYDATISGTGFTTSQTFLDNIQSIENTVDDPDSITDIVVVGGVNDTLYGTIASIGSAITAFVNYCKLTYKNAKVSIGYCGNIINAHSEDMVTSIVYFRDYTMQNGAAYLHNMEYVLRNQKLMNLTHLVGGLAFHPNSDGTAHIAWHIAECILTGSANVNYRGTNQLTTPYICITQIENGNVNVWYRGHLYTGTDFTLDRNTGHVIDTFATNPIMQGVNSDALDLVATTVPALISYDQNNTGTNVQKVIPLEVSFRAGNMVVLEGVGEMVYNHVKAIFVPTFNITGKTWYI